ncbi:MAG TPA: phosphatase PAP2 family protein [Longimicrobiales bacterium]|nr:phosphatase PAP2 family protein [Longimicrobiales bacterium]
MSGAARERLTGQPLDRLFALYMAAAVLPLAFPHRPAAWPLLLTLHALVVSAGWPLFAPRRMTDALSPAAQRRLRTLADWAPLLLMPLLYAELETVNRAIHDGFYFDATIMAWEQSLFGGQPSRDWAARAPRLWLSEPLHAAYLSYYFIIFAPAVLLFLRAPRDHFRAALFALMLTFFVHYLCFIYFPVQGPRYLAPPPGGALSDGPMYRLAHAVLEAGSSRGAAFPSSHVGVAVAQTLIAWRYLPGLAPLLAVLTLGLAAGAIYGGFHYAIDVLCGAVLGAVLFTIAEPLRRRLAAASS